MTDPCDCGHPAHRVTPVIDDMDRWLSLRSGDRYGDVFVEAVQQWRDEMSRLADELCDVLQEERANAAGPGPSVSAKPSDTTPDGNVHAGSPGPYDELLAELDDAVGWVHRQDAPAPDWDDLVARATAALRSQIAETAEAKKDAGYWMQRFEQVDRERADWKRWCEEREAALAESRPEPLWVGETRPYPHDADVSWVEYTPLPVSAGTRVQVTLAPEEDGMAKQPEAS